MPFFCGPSTGGSFSQAEADPRGNVCRRLCENVNSRRSARGGPDRQEAGFRGNQALDCTRYGCLVESRRRRSPEQSFLHYAPTFCRHEHENGPYDPCNFRLVAIWAYRRSTLGSTGGVHDSSQALGRVWRLARSARSLREPIDVSCICLPQVTPKEGNRMLADGCKHRRQQPETAGRSKYVILHQADIRPGRCCCKQI